jgi:CxxC motif-containing protein
MITDMTCIECPMGCIMAVTVEKGKVVKVERNKCPKGAVYAAAETERPVRILTSTVMAEGMEMRMVPVRTDAPIPKNSMMRAMDRIRRMRITRPVQVGEVVLENIAGSGVNLIATRECDGAE